MERVEALIGFVLVLLVAALYQCRVHKGKSVASASAPVKAGGHRLVSKEEYSPKLSDDCPLVIYGEKCGFCKQLLEAVAELKVLLLDAATASSLGLDVPGVPVVIYKGEKEVGMSSDAVALIKKGQKP